MVRYPNYLGEILVWIGNFVIAIPFYNKIDWIFSLIRLVCIILIMLGSGKRLEINQDNKYGNNENYKAYKSKMPVIIPYIPIYTLKNRNFYLE